MKSCILIKDLPSPIHKALKLVLGHTEFVTFEYLEKSNNDHFVAIIIAHEFDREDLLSLRRRGFRTPIIYLSFGSQTDKDDFWFADFYDELLVLPNFVDHVRAVVERLKCRLDRRRPLVDRAIANSWRYRFQTHARNADHGWRNRKAILRFLRGAQIDWAIHPSDAKAIVNKIGNNCPEEERHLISQQLERWDEYETAFKSRAEKVFEYTERADGECFYTALLIDDQAESYGWGELLKHLLFRHGFRIITDIGKDYLNIVAREQPDLIILDLHYEGVPDPLHGLSILQEIQAKYLTIPVILFTAHERLSLERNRRELGLVGYIVKEEENEQQDAEGYYNRLIQHVTEAIEHRMRFILLSFMNTIKWIDPSFSQSGGTFLSNALHEINDHISCSNNTALAIELIMKEYFRRDTKDLKIKDSLAPVCEAIEKKFGPLWGMFANIARSFRNVNAHPESGTLFLGRDDANLGCILAVFLASKLSNVDLRCYSSDMVNVFTRILLNRCADNLQSKMKDIPDPGIKTEMANLIESLRIADLDTIGALLPRLFSVTKEVFQLSLLTLPPIILSPTQTLINLGPKGKMREKLTVWPEMNGTWSVSNNKYLRIVETDGDHHITRTTTPLSEAGQRINIQYTIGPDNGMFNNLTVNKVLTLKVSKDDDWRENPLIIYTDKDVSKKISLATNAQGNFNLYSIKNSEGNQGSFEATIDTKGQLEVTMGDGCQCASVTIKAKKGKNETKDLVVKILSSEQRPSDFFMNLLALETHFVDGTTVREGFEHGGITATCVLRYAHTIESVLMEKGIEDLGASEKLLLTAILTRMILWCADSAIVRWNPEKHKLFEHCMGNAGELDSAFHCCRSREADLTIKNKLIESLLAEETAITKRYDEARAAKDQVQRTYEKNLQDNRSAKNEIGLIAQQIAESEQKLTAFEKSEARYYSTGRGDNGQLSEKKHELQEVLDRQREKLQKIQSGIVNCGEIENEMKIIERELRELEMTKTSKKTLERMIMGIDNPDRLEDFFQLLFPKAPSDFRKLTNATKDLIGHGGDQKFAMEEIKIIVDEFFENCKAG